VSSGKTFVGCNVENAAYPEGTCAEAGAIAAMVAAGESEIEEIFIVAVGSEPISPCGGCRQKISEFSRSDTPVILANPNGDMVHKTAGELLPDSFKPSHLEK
jgi:cytidine deaminase